MKLFNDQEKETRFFASIKSHGTKISSQGSWNGAAHLRRPFFFFWLFHLAAEDLNPNH